MEIKYYQTIPELGIFGRMNTPEEFEKMGLPKSLDGSSVLDIGCNSGAFMIECHKRGANDICGIEVDRSWRLLAQGIIWEYERYCVAPRDRHGEFIFFEKIDDVDCGFDLVLLLSVLHLVEDPQGLLDKAWELSNGLLIVEINDRLQKDKIKLPECAKYFGKNKDNRSVWHCRK